MDIELAPERLLAALSAGPPITLQSNGANALPSSLFLSRAPTQPLRITILRFRM
jgi:hypothetical protein